MPEYAVNRSSIKWLNETNRVIYRKNGPGYITDLGTVVYFNSSDTTDIFRPHGPASITPQGMIAYSSSVRGLHRIDGPAVIYADGAKTYAIHGIEMDELEFFFRSKVSD